VRRRQIDQSAGTAVSAKKGAAQAHVLHRDVAVRSRAGLGEPVEPVVKMTSAPSFSVGAEAIAARASESAGVSRFAFVSAGAAIDVNDCVPGIGSSESTAMEF